MLLPHDQRTGHLGAPALEISCGLGPPQSEPHLIRGKRERRICRQAAIRQILHDQFAVRPDHRPTRQLGPGPTHHARLCGRAGRPAAELPRHDLQPRPQRHPTARGRACARLRRALGHVDGPRSRDDFPASPPPHQWRVGLESRHRHPHAVGPDLGPVQRKSTVADPFITLERQTAGRTARTQRRPQPPRQSRRTQTEPGSQHQK